MSVDRVYVSELLPLTGLLFIPQKIYEHGEPRWNDTDRGKPKKSEKTSPSVTVYTTNPIPVSLFAPQIPHGLTGHDPGPPRCEADPATNNLNRGTAFNSPMRVYVRL
jgi:hypothetical protein